MNEEQLKALEESGNRDVLFVAGFFKEGKEKKFVAVQVRNSALLNPVAPIFEQYPEMKCVIVGKDEEQVKKYLKKLA